MMFPSLVSGGLIPTYCCSSACAHCLYSCSPKRDSSYIDRATAEKCFRKVRSIGCRTMHIGGGEPFLKPEGLYEVLEAAIDSDVYIEYVETNSSWFTSMDHVSSILQEIRKRGISTLLLSISPFHNEYIPLSKLEGMMHACEQNGISIFPWTMEMLSDVRSMDPSKKNSLEEYIDHFGEGYVIEAMQRYGVIPGGTALKTLEPYMEKHPAEEVIAAPSPCGRLTGTSHFHVDLYENYVPCLCPGLSVKLEDLDGELTHEDYPILNTLVEEGVGGLYDFVVDEYDFTPAEEGYSLPCELCHSIRKYLAIEKNVESKELKPREFYL